MQWLSANFVKLGVAVLLIVGFVIRDDLFPSDHGNSGHDGETADVELVAEIGAQANDHASETRVASKHAPASATTDSTDLAAIKQKTKAESEKSEQSATLLTQSADSAETGKTVSSVSTLAAKPVVKPAAESAAESITKAALSEPVIDSAKPLEAKAATPSTVVKQDAQTMTRTRGDAESRMGSGFGSSFGPSFESGFEAGTGSQSGMNSGGRSGTGMIGLGASRHAYTGDDNQLKPGVNPVEVLSGARQAFWENRFADSAESYRVLLDIQPANWMAWGELGNVYYRKGEMDASGEAYYRSAVLMWHAHRYDEAWRLARIIGNLSPKRALDLAEVFYGDKAAGRSANPASAEPLSSISTTEPTQSSPVSNGKSPALDSATTPANDL